jgi:hypothetical protein
MAPFSSDGMKRSSKARGPEEGEMKRNESRNPEGVESVTQVLNELSEGSVFAAYEKLPADPGYEGRIRVRIGLDVVTTGGVAADGTPRL